MLAIAGTWSSEPALEGAWHLGGAAAAAGLALEELLPHAHQHRAATSRRRRARCSGASSLRAFAFRNESLARRWKSSTRPCVPAGFEPFDARDASPRREAASGATPVTCYRSGSAPQPWPAIPARLLGRLGLAWWPRTLAVRRDDDRVAPDSLRAPRRRPSGVPTGMRPRRVRRRRLRAASAAHLRAGRSARAHRLEGERPSTPPRHARIHAKTSISTCSSPSMPAVSAACARAASIALGSTRTSRRGFAEVVTPNDDRIGLVVFSDRTLARVRAGAGLAGRHAHPAHAGTAAGPGCGIRSRFRGRARSRALLKHRTLIVLLTDLDDAAGIRAAGARRAAAVAAASRRGRRRAQPGNCRALRDARRAAGAIPGSRSRRRSTRHVPQRSGCRLRRLGAPVIATKEELLEQAVFTEYETLRRSRRV